MIRVMHLITDLGAGGAQRSLVNLVNHSDAACFSHSVVSLTDQGALGEELISAGINVHSLGMRRGIPSPSAFIRLVRFLRELKPTILQCWLYHSNLMGLLAGKLVKIPRVIWGIHSSNQSPETYPLLTRGVVWLGAQVSRSPDCIALVSTAGMKLHKSWGYHSQSMVVIPNGIDMNLFRPDAGARNSVRAELGLAGETILIGFVARHHPMKDHATFFRAARHLNQAHPQVHFLLAGSEVTRENSSLSQLIRENGLEGVVHLLGPRKDIPRLTAAFDMATLCSWSEAFPIVVGEAMACGVPCAVTDAGDAATIVGSTGRVVPTRDPEALASAWAELIVMGADGRRILGEKARQRIKENYTLEKMVRAYESLYMRVADGTQFQTTHSVAS
jgi:glycosyltransferase involved in cell wall biosynthesis